MLTLTFTSLRPVPDDLRRETALALRAMVGLTLPAVASSVRGIKPEIHGALYQLMLGDGVPLPGLTLHCGTVHAGPLRVTSEESDDRWYVTVSPLASFSPESSGYSRQMKMQDYIFHLLIPAFAPLTDKVLTLGE
jgi:hypothetical protein